MSSLYVDRRNVHLSLDGDALVFTENGVRAGTVPLAPITRVFLRGHVTLQAGLLGKLGEHGAGVVILSGRKGTPTLMLGRPHNDASRRVRQIRASLDDDFALAYAKDLVAGKIQQQHDWLGTLRERRPQDRLALTRCLRLLQGNLDNLAAIQRIDRLRGLEGAAAGTYFRGLAAVVPPSLDFTGRNRRPPRDPFNALLSLAYTLLIAEAAIHLHGAGFDPYVGFYHQLNFARESLACDIVEPLRPLADAFCLQLVSSQSLVADHFSSTQSGCLLGKAGRRIFYAAWEEHGSTMRPALKKQVRELGNRVDAAMPPPASIKSLESTAA